jgi:hypothetical protein
MLHSLRVGRSALTPPPRTAEILARLFAAALVAASFALLLIGAIGSARWESAIGERGPQCILRSTTGVDCPFCGMTRATLALGAGHLHRALSFHPLAPVVLLGALFVLGAVALGRTRALLIGRRPIVLLAAIVIIWIVRLVA